MDLEQPPLESESEGDYIVGINTVNVTRPKFDLDAFVWDLSLDKDFGRVD